jgi:hypothetical protein
VERAAIAADDGKTVLVDERAGAAAPRGADRTGGPPAASGRVAPLLVTFATGMAVGGPLTFLATEYFEDPARAILSFGTPFFLGFAALVGVGTLAAHWFLARWLPGVLGTLDRIVAAGHAAARAAIPEQP